ncbi:MAG: T9SS type A sorting domain-containing protein, partial [Bacteroidota bacterium]
TGIDYHLPIGTAANFELAEIYIESQNGLNYIDVSFSISNQNPVPGGLTVDGVPVDEFLDYGYWTFTPNAGLTAVSYHATIQSKGHTDKGGTEDNYSLINDIGSGWQDLGIHSSATQEYSVTTVKAKRYYLTSFGSYIIGYLSTDVYNPPPVTDELRVKGSFYKVHAWANSTIIGDVVSTNITNNGILDVQNLSDFHTEGGINNEATSLIQLDGNINIEGDWINNATVNSTGEIIFGGNTNQIIGGSNITSFENFTINKSSGNVILNINTIITNTLTLSSGIIETGSNTLICSSTSISDITGYSNSSFIYGNLRKSITTNTETYPLPVGNGTANTNYHLTEFINNNLTGVTALDVSVASISEAGNNVDANLDPLKAIQDGTELVNVLEDAEWEIDPIGSFSGGSFGINLYVDNISNLSSADDFEFCIVKRPSSSTNYADWDAFGSTTTIPNDNMGGRTYITYDGGGFPVGPGYAQRTGYTSFSKFAIAKSDDTPLPIELLSFKAILNNNIVELFWLIATEINNDYFTVEKAIWDNNKEELIWEFVLNKSGAGNSNAVIEYNDVDKYPYTGISYYRLKQTDFDGRYSYSNIVQIKNTDFFNNTNFGLGFTAYPNPSYNKEIIIVSSQSFFPDKELVFEVYDMLGQVVIIKNIVTDNSGNYNFTINNRDKLPSGIYIARISAISTEEELSNSCSNKLIIK